MPASSSWEALAWLTRLVNHLNYMQFGLKYVSACILQGFFGHNKCTWMPSESTYCENKPSIRFSFWAVTNLGNFDLVWAVEKTLRKSLSTTTVYTHTYMYFSLCDNGILLLQLMLYKPWGGCWCDTTRSSLSSRNQICTCKSLCPKMMSTGQRGQEVSQECTHACQG